MSLPTLTTVEKLEGFRYTGNDCLTRHGLTAVHENGVISVTGPGIVGAAQWYGRRNQLGRAIEFARERIVAAGL